MTEIEELRARVEALQALTHELQTMHNTAVDWRMEQDHRLNLLEAAMPRALEPMTEVREFIPAPVTHDLANTAPLLWVLWNHLGGSSPIGQPIRQYLGMDQFERMTEDQIQAAKQYRDDLMPEATTPVPAGSLVERVKHRLIKGLGGTWEETSCDVIREVAKWLKGRQYSDHVVNTAWEAAAWLEHEASRLPQ